MALKEIKLRKRRKIRRILAAQRISIKVLAQGAFVAQDSTHVGYASRKRAWAEVSKDAATFEAEAFGDGKPITAQAMIERLEGLKANGRLPLILSTDNGSAYKSHAVESWLLKNQVIHLKSRVHTPTDNARIERAIGEAKHEAGLDEHASLERPQDGVICIQEALQRINRRPRASCSWQSAEDLTSTLPWWYISVSRHTFFESAREAICSAVQNLNGRLARMAEREAIFRTLELFGLIRRTRGGQPIAATIPDTIS